MVAFRSRSKSFENARQMMNWRLLMTGGAVVGANVVLLAVFFVLLFWNR
jgi:hypothetical protein